MGDYTGPHARGHGEDNGAHGVQIGADLEGERDVGSLRRPCEHVGHALRTAEVLEELEVELRWVGGSVKNRAQGGARSTEDSRVLKSWREQEGAATWRRGG